MTFPDGYSPDPKLIRLFLASAEATISEIEGVFESDMRNAILGEFEQESHAVFASYVQSAIVRYAILRAYSTENDDLLRHGEDSFREFAIDRFQIIPEHQADFFDILIGDLVKAVTDGMQIDGDWGSVYMPEGGGLAVRLHRPHRFVTPGFKASIKELTYEDTRYRLRREQGRPRSGGSRR